MKSNNQVALRKPHCSVNIIGQTLIERADNAYPKTKEKIFKAEHNDNFEVENLKNLPNYKLA